MPTCLYCGEEFEAKRADAEFCKDAHRKAYKRNSPDTPLSPDTVIADKEPVIADNVSEVISPDKMLAEANRLVQLQRDERGQVPGPVIDGKTTTRLGPYVPTPEREARASQILFLRKYAMRPPIELKPSNPTEVAQLAKEKGVSVVVARLLLEQRKKKTPATQET